MHKTAVILDALIKPIRVVTEQRRSRGRRDGSHLIEINSSAGSNRRLIPMKIEFIFPLYVFFPSKTSQQSRFFKNSVDRIFRRSPI